MARLPPYGHTAGEGPCDTHQGELHMCVVLLLQGTGTPTD